MARQCCKELLPPPKSMPQLPPQCKLTHTACSAFTCPKLIRKVKSIRLENKLATVYKILKAAEKPVLKAHIISKCYLYDRIEYIDKLVELGLLEVMPAPKNLRGPKTKEQMLYYISPKGKEFLQLYGKLLMLLVKADVGEIR